MKRYVLILFAWFFSCSSTTDSILGIWETKSKYYDGTYKITKAENLFVGTVLNYDDGVRKYTYDIHNKEYVFKNVSKVDGKYTNSLMKSDFIELIQIDENKLKVTTHVLGKPLTEFWIRKH